MSELATLARPYAGAVFKRAKETGSSEKWSKTLAFLAALVSDPSLAALINNPKLGNERLSAMVLELAADSVDAESANFVKLLVQNRRLQLVPYIASVFEAYKAEDEGYIDVEVFAAYKFSADGKKDLTARLEKRLGKKVNMKVTVDRSLLGGILVRAGDMVIDGSVKGQLQQLQKALQ